MSCYSQKNAALKIRFAFFDLSVALLSACSSTKNTGGTRWYHSFNTRYNVYFNGNEAYKQAWQAQLEAHTENYSEMILMHPVSALPKEKSSSGGPFDKSIEKAVKAIKTHSIQTKPNRQANKRNDPKYQEFMSRKEYNPFLHNAWMMMAKSQFHNGDFLESASSFSYISRLYESQPEIAIPAKLWKARCYSELGWFYEADDILSKLNNDKLPKNQTDWFSTVYADYLIKQKQYAEAIPYMKRAVKSEKNKFQRTREKYLLGQLYTATGQKELAYQTFREVSSANAPYILELSARIRQTEVYPGGDIAKMSKQLNKMAKSAKNKEYLDQIYYALGNVYMTVPDTTQAVESYELGVEKSKRNGIDKMLNQVKLGDIYFNRRQYLDAQPNYSEALTQLKKEDEAYPHVAKRSEALDALVIHFEAVELQDSLQRLSRMTEDERLVVVNKIIEDLIAKEKEEKEKADREEYMNRQEDLRAQQQANRPNSPSAAGVTPPGEAGAFYFYNTQVVAIGKNAFQQKWGRRKLEDDWRRRNKTNPLSDFSEEAALTEAASSPENAIDSTENAAAGASLAESSGENLSSDPKDPQFYLQQIPVTEEELAASDLIISDGLFNMAVIYKDLLEDHRLALETFETLDTRFPDNENKMMSYYYTYLIYWREGNGEMADSYKAKIRAAFPESDLAIAMANPDYEYNQKRMDVIQDSLYQQTYADYLDDKPMEIRKNYELISSKYNQSKLMPKFMFLNALSFVQTNEADTFKVLLKTLIDKFPTEDVSALASEMMKGFQRGLLLSASGDNMLARGSLFNMRLGGEEDVELDSTVVFSAETKTPHELLLIYPKESLNDNLLVFTVAGFNFGNFMVNDFGLERTTFGEIGILRIKGFNNQEEVMQYLQMIYQPDGYAAELGQSVVVVPISADNYSILMKGKSLEEYRAFFEEHFAAGNEKLLALWQLKKAEELNVLPEESPKTEPVDLSPEKTQHSEPENQPISEETKQDTIQANTQEIVLQTDTIQPLTQDSLQTKAVVDSDKVIDSVNDVYNQASDKANALSGTLNEIASDPIRGILNLFKRKKSKNAIDEFVKQQEKEEKERLNQQKKEQEEKEKAAKALAKQQEKEKQELLKKQAEEEKAALKAKEQQEKELVKEKENEKKQKEAEKKRLAKEKKEAREKALRERKAELKAKEKARKEAQKQKEKEREALRKQKEAERKAKKK
jgi:tetratricopeptide (TPR) repeat protein